MNDKDILANNIEWSSRKPLIEAFSEIEALKAELAKEKKYISDSIDAAHHFNCEMEEIKHNNEVLKAENKKLRELNEREKEKASRDCY